MEMKYFDIRVDFRGKRITGHINDYGEYLLITFTEDEVLKEFGGQFKLSADFKTIEHHYHPDDEKKFHNAIVHELMRLEK
jgi:hypothetical protein